MNRKGQSSGIVSLAQTRDDPRSFVYQNPWISPLDPLPQDTLGSLPPHTGMFLICVSSLFLAALAQADSNVTAHVPQTAPSDAFKVPADFFGFGWESGSGDHIYFDPNQKAATTCDSGPLCKKNSKDTFYIGPSYFDTFRLFQKNTTAPMSIQAPMGPDMPMNYTVAYVDQAWKALGSSRVAAIALGNEPNWYKDSDGNRITAKKYVDDALKVETRLSQKLEGDSSPVYQIAEIASQGVTKEGNPFNMSVPLSSRFD